MTQIDLITGQPVEPARDPGAGVTLTERQALALRFIGQHQPVSSDELGAHLHADRLQRGGRGHTTDERCDWCPREGRVMGSSLRRRGLVIQKRSIGWCLPDWRPTSAEPTSQNAGWPEGF